MFIVSYFLLVALVVLSIVNGSLMFRRRRNIKQHPIISNMPKISIIIPARNEEHNLEKLLNSIALNDASYEIIVVDDQSTDRTKNIAKKFGANVIEVDKDAHWKGKSQACWQGAKGAKHNLLLFLDADVELANKNSLKNIYSQYNLQASKGLLSIQPYHTIKKKYENLSAIFNLFTLVGMNIFSFNHRKNDDKGAFGPVLFTNKQDYVDTKGHLNAEGAIIEGFSISKAYEKLNLPVELYEGAGVVNFRMYPEGIRSLINGWSKHFASGSTLTKPSVMFYTISWLTGSVVSLLLLLISIKKNTILFINALVIYITYAIQFFSLIRRVGNFHKIVSIFHPLLFAFFTLIYAKSWIDIHIFKKVKWKDRKIDLSLK